VFPVALADALERASNPALDALPTTGQSSELTAAHAS